MMLDETLQSQLRAYLTKIVQPVELIASLDESQGAQEMRALLETIASLTDKVSVRLDGQQTRRPSFQIRRAGADTSLHFAAVPLGHEFTSLVLALPQTADSSGQKQHCRQRSGAKTVRHLGEQW